MFPQVKKAYRLPFPASPKLKVVQVGKGRRFDGVEQISDSPANVLVGPTSELQNADIGIDHAIFVLTGLQDHPIDDVFRVSLWQRFGVPVFELLLDGHDEICAAECEAHDGLHVSTGTTVLSAGGELVLSIGKGKKLFTGLSGTIETTECACGISGVRITDLQLQTRRLAASA